MQTDCSYNESFMTENFFFFLITEKQKKKKTKKTEHMDKTTVLNRKAGIGYLELTVGRYCIYHGYTTFFCSENHIVRLKHSHGPQ